MAWIDVWAQYPFAKCNAPGQRRDREHDPYARQSLLNRVRIERDRGPGRQQPTVELARPPAGPECAARRPPQRLYEHGELGDEPRKQRLRFDERGLRASGAQRLRERSVTSERT